MRYGWKAPSQGEQRAISTQADLQARVHALTLQQLVRDPAPTLIGYSGRSERAMAEWSAINGS